MRRSTAVRRVRTIAERCQSVCRLWEPGTGLVAVHTYGGVLDPQPDDDTVEVVQVVLVVEEPPERLTWGTHPPHYAGLSYVLELEKAPVDWCFRPSAGPIGNHRIDRPLRVWSRACGVHEDALVALAARDVATLDVLRESRARPPVLRRHLAEELAAATAHLRHVRDRYWQRPWRSDHHDGGTDPEHHLWDAVNGYLDLIDGLDAAERIPAAAPPPPAAPGERDEPAPADAPAAPNARAGVADQVRSPSVGPGRP